MGQNSSTNDKTPANSSPQGARNMILAFGYNLSQRVANNNRDSLTKGYYNYGMEYHPYSIILNKHLEENNLSDKYFVYDSGVNGETSLSMRSRINLELETCKYEIVIILAGTNDLGRYKSEDICANLKAIHETALKTCKYTIAVTVPCATLDAKSEEEDWGKYQNNKKMLNLMIKEFVEQNDRIELVDLYEIMNVNSYTTEEEVKKIWDDRLHFTPHGYDTFAGAVWPVLQKLLAKLN
jgi:lysophospholipase L1-like esterase